SIVLAFILLIDSSKNDLLEAFKFFSFCSKAFTLKFKQPTHKIINANMRGLKMCIALDYTWQILYFH
ncbi:MAG: hypothetical protein EBR67_10265, partial [Proteobacteria bacterium]|nr:hypothetical protein [Pseudomonadota bacterium]